MISAKSAASSIRRPRTRAVAALSLYLMIAGSPAVAGEAATETCTPAADGEKTLLFGDLHVHTAYSLDAYAFGATATPREAYDFARGQPLRLANGEMIAIGRPLDFAAVTDHAETFDITYTCTDPMYSDLPYCARLRNLEATGQGPTVFVEFLLPAVSSVPPVAAPFCDRVDCPQAYTGQWRRIQEAANNANEPCAFTALIGYEWSATPGGRHWHRNVIYRSEHVPDQAFDYIRYPEVSDLWRALAEHCRVEDGCDAIAIPHNLNWSDGGTFEVEGEDPGISALRARYERLAEIHQEKGSSECLPATRDTVSEDCDFELLPENSAKLRLSGPDTDPEAAWQAARSGYYRTLLGRGLTAWAKSGGRLDPLKLGAIGSTDGHFGAPGFTEEATFPGGVYAIWADDEGRLARPLYNPGGLVGVWAEVNTRASIFDALKRREAYATSGTRIRLRFGSTRTDACNTSKVDFLDPMGTTLTRPGIRTFTVQAAMDHTPLAAVDIVKGTIEGGHTVESVQRVAEFPEGQSAVCVTWTDEDANAAQPAYWYARVIEQPSPRWSKYLCEKIDACDKFPDADRMIEDRAWSSPIWYLPGS